MSALWRFFSKRNISFLGLPAARWSAAPAAAHAGQIARMYRLLLGRPADQDGMASALRALRRGVPLARLIEGMLESDEFARRAQPAPANADNIDAMFETAFGHAPPVLGVARATCPVAAYAALLITEAEAQSPTPFTAAMYPHGFDPDDAATYRRWLQDHYAPGIADRANPPAGGAAAADIAVSLLLLQTARWRATQATLLSVHAQNCTRFELIVVGDEDFCRRASALHPPAATIMRRPSAANGALNAALAQCRGRFVFLLTEGMRLAPDAIFHIAAAQSGEAAQAATGFLVDHDLIDRKGRRHSPHFATGWDAETAMAAHDWPSCTLLRTEAARGIGGARETGACGAWAELSLRVAAHEGGARVRHIPRPLFSLPAPSGPAAWLRRFLGERPRARELARMLTEHRDRLAAAHATKAPGPAVPRGGPARLVYKLPHPAPLVSIIIPTRDKPDLLRACLDGIVRRTDYAPLEILVVDNQSVDPRTAACLRDYANLANLRVLPFDRAFNWGAINNFAVRQSHGEVVLLLNNDTEVIDPAWLTELVAQAIRPEVGAVGAKLLYRNGRVQHAGMIFGPDAQSYHRFRHVRGTSAGYGGALATVRQVSAVTGACVALRRAIYDEVGGIEEAALAVTWSDVDLCFRVRQHGYRVVWTPFARLMHLELATRGADTTPERAARAERERHFMLSRWAQLAGEDPFYNPNLHLGEGRTRIAGSPRRGVPPASLIWH